MAKRIDYSTLGWITLNRNSSLNLALEVARAVMTTQKRQTSIYLSDPMRKEIQAIATKEQRSFTFIVEMLLREALDARSKAAEKS